MSADELMHWMAIYQWKREAAQEQLDRQTGTVRPQTADDAAAMLDRYL